MENRLGTHKYVLSVRPDEFQRSAIYENIPLDNGHAYHARIETIGSRTVPRIGGSCNCGEVGCGGGCFDGCEGD